jgi:hypothetical protein
MDSVSPGHTTFLSASGHGTRGEHVCRNRSGVAQAGVCNPGKRPPGLLKPRSAGLRAAGCGLLYVGASSSALSTSPPVTTARYGPSAPQACCSSRQAHQAHLHARCTTNT